VDPRIGIVLKIIEEQKGDIHLGLNASSTVLGVSEAHLFRLFKREVGVTFRKYLRKRRMTQAAELVSDSSLAIKRIALVSGYSDVSNFYRDFKQIHGVSPRKWRIGKLVLQAEELLRDDPNAPHGTLRIKPT